MQRTLSAIALVLLLVTGCTSGFVYNRLDTLVAWYLEGLVTLTKSQRAELRGWLGETLNWHRESELERYAAFLKNLADRATQPGNRTTFEQAETQFRAFTGDVAKKSAPEAAHLLLALSDRQVDELTHNLEKKATERLEEERELLEDDAWHDRRAKQITKQFKRWVGKPNREQLDAIERTARELQPSYPEWFASQRAWRAALREAMSKRANDPDAARRELTGLLASPERYWTDEYKAKLAQNRERTLALLVELDNSLSNDQRHYLQKRLHEFAAQLEALAGADMKT